MRIINKKNKQIPSYIQLKQILAAEIQNAEQEFKLPSIRKLMKFHKVSQNTVEKALFELGKDGFINKKNSLGVFAQKNGEQQAAPAIIKDKGFIGIEVFDLINFTPKIIKNIKRVVTNAGYTPLIFSPTGINRQEETQFFVDFLLQNDTKGFIGNPNIKMLPEYQKLTDNFIPQVFITGSMAYQADYVLNDDVQGGFLAANHLIEKGHTDVLCVMYDNDVGEDRLNGVKKAFSKNNLAFNNEMVIKNPNNSLDIKSICTKITQGKFTAVFAYNDVWALEIYWALKGIGLKVPDDIALIGYDDSEIIKISRIPLTTVAQPYSEIGEQAANFLLSRMEESNQQKFKKITLEPKLIIRETT